MTLQKIQRNVLFLNKLIIKSSQNATVQCSAMETPHSQYVPAGSEDGGKSESVRDAVTMRPERSRMRPRTLARLPPPSMPAATRSEYRGSIAEHCAYVAEQCEHCAHHPTAGSVEQNFTVGKI